MSGDWHPAGTFGDDGYAFMVHQPITRFAYLAPVSSYEIMEPLTERRDPIHKELSYRGDVALERFRSIIRAGVDLPESGSGQIPESGGMIGHLRLEFDAAIRIH